MLDTRRIIAESGRGPKKALLVTHPFGPVFVPATQSRATWSSVWLAKSLEAAAPSAQSPRTIGTVE